MQQIPWNDMAKPVESWLDVGAGTGQNLEWALLPQKPKNLQKVCLLDLTPSLLKKAQERIQKNSWNFVNTMEADATQIPLPDESVDLVSFSYSLTMIPDWFLALKEAQRVLKPGGKIAVVDFYIPRKFPKEDMAKKSWLPRQFWRAWFDFDNVFLSQDLLPYLRAHFEEISQVESESKVPYMMGLSVPVFLFVGSKTR